MLAILSQGFEAAASLMHDIHLKDARTDWKRVGDKLLSACRRANAFDDSIEMLRECHPEEYIRRKASYLTILYPILTSLRRYASPPSLGHHHLTRCLRQLSGRPGP